MWVTVWRHGEASPGAPDEFRPLTSRGRSSLQSAARRFLLKLETHGAPNVQRLAFSPLVRTTQTAEIIAAALALDPDVCPALAPGATHQAPDTFLVADLEHQLIVSHQPFVSRLIDHWLDPSVLAPLAPGGFACLRLLAPEQGAGEVVFAEPAVF